MDSRRKAGLALLLVAVLLAGYAGFSAMAKAGILGDDLREANCESAVITVAAAPEIAPIVKSSPAKVPKADPCNGFTVTSPTRVDDLINRGTGPDVWIPDSTTWLDALGAKTGTAAWKPGVSLAHSPVILASPTASPVAVNSFTSWADIVNTSGQVRMANPDVDTASRLAYLNSRQGSVDTMNLQTAAKLIFISRYAKPTTDALFEDAASTAPENKPFPVSEQQFAARAKKDQTKGINPVVPSAGTMFFDYPWIPGPHLTPAQRKVAEAGLKELQSPATKAALKDAGFRDTENGGGPTIGDKQLGTITATPLPQTDKRREAVDQWDVLRTDMRMLAVIDVSGSMADNAPGLSVPRWQITEDAAVKALQLIPAGSQIGGWIFSTNKDGAQDYKDMAPVARLDSADGASNHRDTMINTVRGMKSYIGGDTALFDSALAAFKKMTNEYDPKYINSVVIMTDGKNDNPKGGLNLPQLLDALKKAYNPDRPVRIITIGMGDADPAELDAISKATGGTSYIANTAADIERVFVTALLARIGTVKK